MSRLDLLKDSVANICSSFDKKLHNRTDPSASALSSNKSQSLLKSVTSNNIDTSRHALEFSFSVLNESTNQSEIISDKTPIIVQQTIDDNIVEILKNSDATTRHSIF